MTQTDKPSNNGKVVALAVAGAFGGFLFGFDASVINGAVNAIQDEYALTATLTGFAVASALLGAAAGAYLGGRVGDRYGRIPVMLLGSIMFFVSSVGSAFAFSVYDLVLWRIVGGLGIGLASVVAPAYIAEISPRAMRGRLGSLQQLAITIGIFSALLSDALFANSAGGAGEPSLFGIDAWRWMFLACAFPAAVYFVIAKILPESPRFLVLKDRETEARAVFTRLWPNGDVEREIRDIRASIKEDALGQRVGSLRGKTLGLRPIVWVGILLSVFQQFVGINVIFFYSTTLWKAVGFEESSSLTISVLTGLTNIAVTFIAIALIDRVGRRPILLTGSIGMTLSLATMAIAFSQAVTVDGEIALPGAWGGIALVAANVFVVFFGASWGPVVWVLLGEMFPNTIRVKALGVAAAAQWIANFLIAVTFPSMAAVSLPLTYGVYALFAALSFVFVLTKIPETNGMSLDEASTLLPPRNSAKIAARTASKQDEVRSGREAALRR
ncbi:sugar porter family MFS transporter [Cryobacterium sinapicolor]|uniref:Sugar porter family MFS transporter n=1 Tax=Cryobacterium sinapicolor TaxID=1259236 RepID=A0ABY2JHR7_9MICO|nr:MULTISPECIES: sugar porter family MFS transporter [Cryobacterium]TFC84618.1 sugar porter family MFS transporter [Cryobacterium sp. TMT3-29-2]TFD04339.1 sugar porter family MFS transporter [Cryobacterium sinapicolor]